MTDLHHHLLSQRGWQVGWSFEPNEASRELAKQQFGLPAARVLSSASLDATAPKVGVILCKMVLEYLKAPWDTVRDVIRPLLTTGGLFVATVPHADSLNRRIAGKRWIGYSPNEHNRLLTAASARVMVLCAGLFPLRVSVGSEPFTRHDAWRPALPVKRVYKETVMRFAKAIGPGDALLMVGRLD